MKTEDWNMSMYVEILSQAMAGEEEPAQSRASLLDATCECRQQMLETRRRVDGTPEHRLAHEVAYDRALLRLCAALGIETVLGRFNRPLEERDRLEHELATRGIHFPEPDPGTGTVVNVASRRWGSQQGGQVVAKGHGG